MRKNARQYHRFHNSFFRRPSSYLEHCEGDMRRIRRICKKDSAFLFIVFYFLIIRTTYPKFYINDSISYRFTDLHSSIPILFKASSSMFNISVHYIAEHFVISVHKQYKNTMQTYLTSLFRYGDKSDNFE